jgi:hypothetical protein
MSEATNHTPGPWVAERNSHYWHIRPVSGTPPFIGDVCASNPEDADSGLQEANARLVAAAPELLEALKNLVSIPAFNVLLRVNGGHQLRKACEAIDKAEGR